VNGGEAAPRGSQVQPASNQLRVGPFPRLSALCDHGRVGDPDGQCLPAPVATLAVEQGPLGDTEQPRPRIRGIGWQVVEATSGHQECVGHDVLGVARVDAALHESDEVRIRRLVNRAEPRLSIWSRACVCGAHTRPSVLLIPVHVRHACQCVWIPSLLFPRTRFRLGGTSLIRRPLADWPSQDRTQSVPTACREVTVRVRDR